MSNLIPKAFSTGAGTEVKHLWPGVTTPTLLTLLVLPAIYHKFEKERPEVGT